MRGRITIVSIKDLELNIQGVPILNALKTLPGHIYQLEGDLCR